MAAFETDAPTQHPLDFGLARDGGVALFRPDELAMAVSQLTALGYTDRRVDLQGADEATMHRRFQERLHFPDYFGHNLAALDECLGDVAAGEFGWDPSSAGLAVAILGFHDFVGREPELAQQFVESLVRASREGLLFGHRVLWRGRQPKLNRRQEAHLVSLVHSGDYSTAEVADLFGIGRSTVYRAIDRQRVDARAGLAEVVAKR